MPFPKELQKAGKSQKDFEEKTIHQTQQLTKNIRSIFKDENYPILIDEEGGRVSRLRKFIDNSVFNPIFSSYIITRLNILGVE